MVVINFRGLDSLTKVFVQCLGHELLCSDLEWFPRVDCQQPVTVLCHHKYNWRVILDRVLLQLGLCRSVVHFAVNLNAYLTRTITALSTAVCRRSVVCQAIWTVLSTGWVRKFQRYSARNEVVPRSWSNCYECGRVHCAVFRHRVYYCVSLNV